MSEAHEEYYMALAREAERKSKLPPPTTREKWEYVVGVVRDSAYMICFFWAFTVSARLLKQALT